MAFDATEPAANKRGKDTRQQILDNFAEIQTFMSENHEDFGTQYEGKHKWVTFPDQGTQEPNGAFENNEIGLFATTPTSAPLTGNNEIFVRRSDNTIFPWSAGNSSTAANLDTNIENWSYLPNGMIIKWANQSFPADFSGSNVFEDTYVWNVGGAYKPFNNVFAVFLSVTQLGTVASSLSTGVYTYLRPTATNNLQVGWGVSRFTFVPNRAGQISIIAIGI